MRQSRRMWTFVDNVAVNVNDLLSTCHLDLAVMDS